jgi:Protein of unknown function (DUF3105)
MASAVGLLLALTGCEAATSVCAAEAEEQATVDSPHTDDALVYDDAPPTSGPHNSCWGEWGVHTEPLPDDNWVHNMEHGGVVFLYNCPDGCPNAVERLTALVTDLGDHAILTPYAEMTWKFGVVSWGWRQEFTCVDEDAMEAFYQAHADDAPESSTSDPSEGCME